MSGYNALYLDPSVWSFNTVWSVNPNGVENSFYYEIYSNIWLAAIMVDDSHIVLQISNSV